MTIFFSATKFTAVADTPEALRLVSNIRILQSDVAAGNGSILGGNQRMSLKKNYHKKMSPQIDDRNYLVAPFQAYLGKYWSSCSISNWMSIKRSRKMVSPN